MPNATGSLLERAEATFPVAPFCSPVDTPAPPDVPCRAVTAPHKILSFQRQPPPDRRHWRRTDPWSPRVDHQPVPSAPPVRRAWAVALGPAAWINTSASKPNQRHTRLRRGCGMISFRGAQRHPAIPRYLLPHGPRRPSYPKPTQPPYPQPHASARRPNPSPSRRPTPYPLPCSTLSQASGNTLPKQTGRTQIPPIGFAHAETTKDSKRKADQRNDNSAA